MKKIFVIDDHPIVQQGLAQLLGAEAELEVCGDTAGVRGALESVRTVQPDLVVLDLDLNGLNGLNLIKDLRAFFPNLPVLVFSMHDELVYAERALRAGARGYVMKMVPATQVLAAIHSLLQGEVYVSDAIAKRAVNRLIDTPQPADKGDQSPVETLSDRELQVLRHIGQGKSTRTIAEELHISVKTVDTHRMHLKEKLHLPDSQSILRFAIEWARQGNFPEANLLQEQVQRSAAAP